MTTKQMDYCIELARTLNFTRAAENQFVSQPTLTYQIKLLEEEIGFPLFERSGRGAALTPAGVQFVSFLIGMREDLKQAIEQGQNFSARYRDSISVSMMVRQALFFLPEAMRQKEQCLPNHHADGDGSAGTVLSAGGHAAVCRAVPRGADRPEVRV